MDKFIRRLLHETWKHRDTGKIDVYITQQDGGDKWGIFDAVTDKAYYIDKDHGDVIGWLKDHSDEFQRVFVNIT